MTQKETAERILEQGNCEGIKCMNDDGSFCPFFNLRYGCEYCGIEENVKDYLKELEETK